MFFYALTSAGPRGWCWNPSLKGEGFNDTRGIQQMLMNQKFMFDRYFLHKVILSLDNFVKRFEKFIFVLIMARKSMKDS